MGRQKRQLPHEIHMVATVDGLEVWAALTMQRPAGVAAPVYAYRASDGTRTIEGVLGPLLSTNVAAIEDEVLRRILAVDSGLLDRVDAGPNEADRGAPEEDHDRSDK